MMIARALLLIGCLFFPAHVTLADETTPSSFRDSPYKPQNTVYEFNFPTPQDGARAFGFLHNHLNALEEFGDAAKDSHLVIVTHGQEVHYFARKNADVFPDAYANIKKLTDRGVKIYLCRNSARGKGYDVDDFYDLVTVVPAGMSEVAHWQQEGYTYVFPTIHPKFDMDSLRQK